MVAKRFLQYCLIGLSGLFVDMLVLYVLCDPRMLAFWVIPGKVAASETAILNNFLWNDLWTFRDRRPANGSARATLRRLAQFNAICGMGLVWNVALLSLFTHVLRLNLYLANLLAILAVTLWNFSLNCLTGSTHSIAHYGSLRGQPIALRTTVPFADATLARTSASRGDGAVHDHPRLRSGQGPA